MKRFLPLLAACLLSGGEAEPIKQVRAYYFGNSLTGCTDPKLHAELVKPLGLTWTMDYNMGAGWQLWQHREAVLEGVDLSKESKGDLTLDPSLIKTSTIKKFYKGPWDVMVLQPFEQSLSFTTDKMWGPAFKAPKDVGDVACATDLINVYLKNNPAGKVAIYTDWPCMKPGKAPAELPAWAQAIKAKGKEIRAAEFPDRAAFDYEQDWLIDKYTGANPGKPWLDKTRSQDFHYQLFEALKSKFPKLWDEGRLVMIPVGDVWMALHKKAKAGQFGDITNISDFYTDVQHTRGGLPRYSAAATFFAVLFQRQPHELDWKAYNDPAYYGKDENHDSGEHFPITDERAKVVHDTIMEVVKGHKYTKM